MSCLRQLTKGKVLRTLRDGGEYVAALPKKESALPHWQVAASYLLTAVEKGARHDGADWDAARLERGPPVT